MHFREETKTKKCHLDKIDGQVKAALSGHVTKASGLQESVPEANWSSGSPGAEPA